MKDRAARTLILLLIGSALCSIWWTAFELHLSEVKNDKTTSIKPTTVNKKPYFVLHVGPPKTATTTIQCGLHDLSADLARDDSYYFIGKSCPGKNETMPNGEKAIPGHHLMMGLINANPNSRGFEKLKATMDYHYAHGNNIVFSLEAMSNHLEDKPETWKLFLSLFEGWNVRVVVAYRHYFDWIRSMYFQQHIGKKYRELWPHQKGLKHPSFQDFLSYHLQRWEEGKPSNDGHSWGQHLTVYAFEYFSRHFRDVCIFNLHQNGDVVENFVCQMLPDAKTSCQRLKSQSVTVAIPQRESHSFDAERLAMAGYSSGIMEKNIYRANVVKRVKEHLEKEQTLADFDNMACLPEGLKSKFLNASLWFEEKVSTLQKEGLKSNQGEHRSLFDGASKSNKFCEIDPEKILKVDEWRVFFQSLKPQGKKK